MSKIVMRGTKEGSGDWDRAGKPPAHRPFSSPRTGRGVCIAQCFPQRIH